MHTTARLGASSSWLGNIQLGSVSIYLDAKSVGARTTGENMLSSAWTVGIGGTWVYLGDPSVTTWFTSLAARYYRMGVDDAMNRRDPVPVDPLYRQNYTEGFAYGQQIERMNPGVD